MFDKVKQLNELRKMRGQAMELQRELEKIVKFYKEQYFKGLVLKEFSTLYRIVFDGDLKLNKKET